MEEKYCIYKHTNKTNGKIYIGQAKGDPERRWNNGWGYKGCTYFYHAIQKYGWDNFEHEILIDGLTLEEANNQEILMIEKYEATNPKKGYNIRGGGRNGKIAESTKEKMRKACIGRPGNRKGKPLSEEHKRKISKANTGKIRSEETRKKLSELNSGENNPHWGTHLTEEQKQNLREKRKGYKNSLETRRKLSEALSGENHPNWGKHLSEETRKKIGEGNKGKHRTEKEKENLRKVHSLPVICIETGIIYDSAKQAEQALGGYGGNVCKCCKNINKTYKGYHWKYVKDIEKEEEEE